MSGLQALRGSRRSRARIPLPPFSFDPGGFAPAGPPTRSLASFDAAQDAPSIVEGRGPVAPLRFARAHLASLVRRIRGTAVDYLFRTILNVASCPVR